MIYLKIFLNVKVLSLLVFSYKYVIFLQSCNKPPPEIITLLKLRLVIGPPLYITCLVFLFIAGFILGAQGFYRIWRPRYKIIPPVETLAPIIRKKSIERRRSSVHENIAFKEDGEMAREAVSLLAIHEEDNDFVELLICDENELEWDLEGYAAMVYNIVTTTLDSEVWRKSI